MAETSSLLNCDTYFHVSRVRISLAPLHVVYNRLTFGSCGLYRLTNIGQLVGG